jgi:hypothetical protein
MGIEDEYNRDYSFEPEFISRKDSLQMHRSRFEKTRKHEKIFKKKPQPLVLVENSQSLEQLALSVSQNIVEHEVDTFRTVKRVIFPKVKIYELFTKLSLKNYIFFCENYFFFESDFLYTLISNLIFR